MPAEPPRQTVHGLQHILLDGFRILRAATPPEIADEELRARLDAMIAQLSPMEGLAMAPDSARLHGLAHGLRTIIDDVMPYMNRTRTAVDPTDFPQTLQRLENGLRELRDRQVAPGHADTGPAPQPQP
jgi:hypothetical protein